MIESLSIRDFALVDRLAMEFDPGFTVLTGETGAGKSILLQALGLLLGDRASRDLIRTGAEAARVEGTFLVEDGARDTVRALLDEAGVEWEEPLRIARTVTADGKGRCHVNGSAVGVALLGRVGAHLVEVSSQHQHQALLDEENHAAILDRALDDGGRRARVLYGEAYGAWEKGRGEVARLEALESQAAERRDFLRFQVDEIRAAGLEAGEDGRLEEERTLLAHAEKLRESYALAEEEVYGTDGALERVDRALKAVEKARANDPRAEGIASLLADATASLDEAARTIRERGEAVRSDPARLEEVEERVETIRRLERKHGKTVAEVLEKFARMERELWELENRQTALEEARAAEAEARKVLDVAASRLTEARRAAAARLEKSVGAELESLGLGRSAFLVSLAAAAPGPSGGETVRFLLAANPGEEPRPLARTASGGELSRILLAVKNALRDGTVGTLVFDEVDAGIGGNVADRVGERLQRLAGACQVLCITHLPQIASRTARHHRVEKHVEKGRTLTRVVKLDAEGRVEELARMLGAKGKGDAAFQHARELAERFAS